jgi:replicative DNA helicase
LDKSIGKGLFLFIPKEFFMQPTLSRTIRTLKLLAKKLSTTTSISYSQALDNIAKTEGFVSWSLLSLHDKSSQIRTVETLCEHLFQSQCVMLAARPNAGKISLAINLSLLAAKTNKSVVYISLNTSKKVIQEKFAAANSSIAHDQFAKLELNLKPEEAVNIQNSLKEILNLPIKIYENEFSLESIKSIVSDKKNHKAFIVVDYVQLIKCDAIEKAIFELKSAAKLNNVSLLFISQLNDAREKNSKIILNSLVGGKMIARHCDWVLGLYREHIYHAEANPKKATLQVIKSKINSLNQFDIHFDPSTGICSW